MAMAPAMRGLGGAAAARLVSKRSGFSVPSPVRLPHRVGGGRAAVPGVTARSSGRRDGWLVDADTAGSGLPLLAEWTELERRHHGTYVAGVRGAVGLLEALLVAARSVLGGGLLAMLLLGVPASLFLVRGRAR
jgi:hypothetical protein